MQGNDGLHDEGFCINAVPGGQGGPPAGTGQITRAVNLMGGQNVRARLPAMPAAASGEAWELRHRNSSP